MRRALLDTNVILAGALWPDSPARSLPQIREQIHFFVPETAHSEIELLVNDLAPSALVARAAIDRVRSFLSALGAIFVPPGFPNDGAPALDPNDALIWATAKANLCDYLCTYDDDYPVDKIKCRSPIALVREFGDGTVESFVQYPILREAGTLMIVARIHHHSSMGGLLRDSEGSSIVAESDGRVLASGPGVVICRQHRPFEASLFSAFLLRYRPGYFDFKQWTSDNGNGPSLEDKVNLRGISISSGELTLKPPVRPLLVFGSNHGFYGEVINISGVPRFLPENRLRTAFRSLTLESVTQGPDVRVLLNSAEVVRAPDGRGVWVGFPRSGSMSV